MPTKQVIIILMIGVILVLGAGSGAVALHQEKERRNLGLYIAKNCNRPTAHPEQVNEVTIGNALIEHQQLTITAACRLIIKPKSTVQFNDTVVRGGHLTISDTNQHTENAVGQPAHLFIRNSQWTGDDGSLLIQLTATGSTIDIKQSHFSYRSAIGISVGHQDTDRLSALHLTDTNMELSSATAEGIYVISTGTITAERNQFSLAKPDDSALLHAPNCQLAENLGANNSCQPPE